MSSYCEKCQSEYGAYETSEIDGMELCKDCELEHLRLTREYLLANLPKRLKKHFDDFVYDLKKECYGM